MNSKDKKNEETLFENEQVILTYNKKENCFLITGRKPLVDEILKTLNAETSIDIRVAYAGWCG